MTTGSVKRHYTDARDEIGNRVLIHMILVLQCCGIFLYIHCIVTSVYVGKMGNKLNIYVAILQNEYIKNALAQNCA